MAKVPAKEGPGIRVGALLTMSTVQRQERLTVLELKAVKAELERRYDVLPLMQYHKSCGRFHSYRSLPYHVSLLPSSCWSLHITSFICRRCTDCIHLPTFGTGGSYTRKEPIS